MEKHYEKAIQYVRDNRNWYEDEESVALRHIDEMRCPLSFAAPSIAENIADLMDEYGEDNDLPDGWWHEFGDEDDIFMAL